MSWEEGSIRTALSLADLGTITVHSVYATACSVTAPEGGWACRAEAKLTQTGTKAALYPEHSWPMSSRSEIKWVNMKRGLISNRKIRACCALILHRPGSTTTSSSSHWTGRFSNPVRVDWKCFTNVKFSMLRCWPYYLTKEFTFHVFHIPSDKCKKKNATTSLISDMKVTH